MLETLFAADGNGRNRHWTLCHVIERLKGIRNQTLYLGNTEIPNAICRPDEQQQQILELLKVKL